MTYYLITRQSHTNQESLNYLMITSQVETDDTILMTIDAESYEEALIRFTFRIDYQNNSHIMGFNGRKVYYI